MACSMYQDHICCYHQFNPAVLLTFSLMKTISRRLRSVMFEQLNITRDIPMEKVFHNDNKNTIMSWVACRHFNPMPKVFRVDDEATDGCPPIVAFLANQADKWEVQNCFFFPAQIGTFWSEKENQHNSPGALSCKGEQGCSGDYRGPAGGKDGAGDPAFCDPVDDRNWLDPCIGPGQQQGQRWRRQQLNWAVRSEKTTVP